MFKRGDLVMLVKPAVCCGSADNLGEINVVLGMGAEESQCDACGSTKHSMMVDLDDGSCVEPQRLRLIPPLDALESIDTDEPLEVTA